MFRRPIIVAVVALFVFMDLSECHEQKNPVQVKVTSLRKGRSRREDGPHYRVQITSPDQKVVSDLSLVPIRTSIFSPNFKLRLGSSDSNGKLVLEDVHIPDGRVQDVENELYFDAEKDAVVILSDNELQLTGIVQGNPITFESGQHFITEGRLDNSDLDNQNESESTLAHSVVRRSLFSRQLHSAPPQYQPELSIVVDSSNYNDLRQDPVNILNYFAILLHAVNTRYATIDKFKVNFTIAGITALKTEADQPFITECYQRSVGGGCDVTGMLMGLFSQWVFANHATLPKSDITALVHNVKVGANGANGAGWIARACQRNVANVTDQSTSVVYDRGGSFAGVHTMTHELAHNLGAPHDGEMVEGQDARSCPYADGYIMSYAKYGGPNKFRFSRCSIELMASYLAANGTCLTTTENPNDHPASSTQGGEFLSMNTQCQTQFKYNPNVFAYTYGREYDDQCKKLVCLIQALYYPGDQQLVSDGYYPAELSSCGINGVCQDGSCAHRPSLNAQCRAALRNNGASADMALPPDALCRDLGCTYNDKDGVQYKKQLGQPALEYSPCGANGRCINSTCRQSEPIPDMTRQCQVLLNNTNALAKPVDNYGIVTPDVLCSYLTCTVGPTAYQSPLPPMDFTPCGEAGNVCFRGTCDTPAKHSDRESRRTIAKNASARAVMTDLLKNTFTFFRNLST